MANDQRRELKTTPNPPSALDSPTLFDSLRSRALALFLDYDGTLTEIVEEPSEAFLSKQTRDLLRLLTSLCTVSILSGRDVQTVKDFVDLEGVVYAGSHGFDIIMPDGKRLEDTRWDKFLPLLDRAEKEFRVSLKGVPGVVIERKRFAIAVHYRKVESSRAQEVREKFDSIASSFTHGLRTSQGKKVFEVLPDVKWNKGEALLFLLKTLRLDRRTLPIFVGDDVTDEDAFRVLRDRGFGILVSEESGRDTLARYSLRDPTEVRLLLGRLVTVLKEERH